MLPKPSDNFDRILQYTAVAADALQEVAETAQIPFFDSVCELVLTIVPIGQVRKAENSILCLILMSFQGIKSQKDRCLCVMEKIHQLLCTLMSLCIHSDEVRSPKMLDQIAQCAL
jgi:hypothetical protein